MFHSILWVYDSKMGASTPTLSYNSPPMEPTTKKIDQFNAKTLHKIDAPLVSPWLVTYVNGMPLVQIAVT